MNGNDGPAIYSDIRYEKGAGGYTAGMRVVFFVYLIGVIAGLAFAISVGANSA